MRQQSRSLPRQNKSDFYSAEYNEQETVPPPYQEKNSFLWECEHPKPSLLSSILDKVCVKNEGHSLECLPWRTESMSYKNCSENLKCDKDSSRRSQEDLDFVQKPYEPPCLGKSSRITPVKAGGEDMPGGVKPLKYSDSVEVLSVIRYNKLKNENTTPSPINFDSGSDIDSIYGHQGETKIELHDTEAIKLRNNGGREISRSLSMSHPPTNEQEPNESELRPDRKFHSLGRCQEKFSPMERKPDSSDPTDLRNLHVTDSAGRTHPSESCHDLTFHDRSASTQKPLSQLQQEIQSQNYKSQAAYSESKKLSNRNLDLISQLLNPDTRDQNQQLDILSQLLQSDLSRFKGAQADPSQLRSGSQQSDNNSLGSGSHSLGDNTKKYSDIKETRVDRPYAQRTDLIRKLSQEELDQNKCSILLEQLLDCEASRTRGSKKEPSEQVSLHHGRIQQRSQDIDLGRRETTPRNQEMGHRHQEIGHWHQETGNRHQGTGQRHQGTVHGHQETGIRLQESVQRYLETGNRHPETGQGHRHHQETSQRHQELGNRHQDTGHRNQEGGQRHQEAGHHRHQEQEFEDKRRSGKEKGKFFYWKGKGDEKPSLP